MKTIQISDETWAVIRARGKFGETSEDDVLRRIFKISPKNAQPQSNGRGGALPTKTAEKQYAWKERRATHEMKDKTGNGNKLILEFDHGPRFEKTFPSKQDRLAIRKLRNEAVGFVRSSGGTKGQEHAAIKALTSRGFHVSKVDEDEFI